ncbi:glycosyltransferase family 4 protein [Salinimicrobium sp. GXAS 041]|uniref:glycosyltransferase family 4 protein n=1 Tax=Salinimicrobium sp. GXAS 041 TaxID=3400806 RepID=UPI003C777519
MKILILSHNFYPFIGGIEVNTELYADHFISRGHQVKILTWTPDPAAKIFGYEVIRDPGPKKIIQAHLWADILFENNPCLRLAWPGFFIKKPFVISLNTWVRRESGKIGFQDKIKMWRLHRSSKVVSASNALRQQTAPSSDVIHNPYRQNMFRVLPHIEKKKQYVFLGRLVSDKGADMAIKAIARLVKRNIAGETDVFLSLTIIGDGPERASLEMLVQELGLENIVEFKGAMRGEELVTCLNQHRYILIPSIWEEPFGMVALEGMACGCLPIASRGGGLAEAVGPGGVLFRRGDLEDLVETMMKLLQDPELESRCRTSAPAHLAAHHSQLVAEKYLCVLTEAVSA